MVPFEISIDELKTLLDSGKSVVLIDVREPFEHEAGHVPGDVLMPMNSVPASLNTLDPDAEIVAYCQMGGRSGAVVDFMRKNGYQNARSLTGGFAAWKQKYGGVK
jgi:rhodanese-related sulfurtransferase